MRSVLRIFYLITASVASALPPKADILRSVRHVGRQLYVCFTSKSDNRKCETHVPDMRHSIDQLVSARAVTAACRAIEPIGARLWALANRHRIARIEVVNPLLPHPHKCTGG